MDSKVAMFWIKGVAMFWIKGEDKEWKQFVHNRVTEIRQLMSAKHWLYCPGKDNPADLPSCGISPKELKASSRWKHRPTRFTQNYSDT